MGEELKCEIGSKKEGSWEMSRHQENIVTVNVDCQLDTEENDQEQTS